jgi:hypothetical protein
MATGISTGKAMILFNIVSYTDNDLSDVEDTLTLTAGVDFADGTAADQANLLWSDTRTLADGGSDELDINDGTLSNNFGVALTMTKLKLLYVRNNSADANLLIGGAATTPIAIFSDAASDKIKLPPEGEMLFIAPNVDGVSVTTNKHIKIAHDGTGSSTLTYDIITIGID